MQTPHAFRVQAQACAELGSPMYAALLTRIADELAGEPILGEILQGHEDDPGPSALALRLVGGVHRQVLAGDATELAEHYPSVGGRWSLDAAWPAFLSTLRQRKDEIVAALDSAPQTNEVGRASALLGGLLHVAAEHPLPIRLFEIGASGGLNLRADQFRYLRADGTSWGPADSPVVLDPAWQGASLPAADVRVVERVGTDLAPVDVASEPGRLTLLSYVWPDMLARLARLRGAFEVADRVPADLRPTDAVTMLKELWLRSGTVTVLWHSFMWQYLSTEDKVAAADRLEALAASATPDQPFAWLRLEPERRRPGADREFLVVLQTWPTGERRVLGTAAPHGVPTILE
ncbi:MAG: DUF2332 family protein [Propionibacteriales bacterium]|nr:DUF2332 family protein [Propionibacteriales bacterium]